MQTLALTQQRVTLLLQLAGTVATLAWTPGNVGKLITMIIVWLLGFRGLSRNDLLLMLGINTLFTIMNLGALRQGIFVFQNPDLLGLPVFEFFMWGFYVLHTLRFIGGRPTRSPLIWIIVMAVAFATPFTTIADPKLLLLVTAIILAGCFAFYHEGIDFAYAGYMIFVGAVIEYTGVSAGQWHYPAPPPGGVPFWFITMWGGIGFFVRRLLLRGFIASEAYGASIPSNRI